MKGLIISHHRAVVEFIKQTAAELSPQTINWEVRQHLKENDDTSQFIIVAGILPLQLWARIKTRRWAVILPDLLDEKRRQELTLEDMCKFGAKIWEVDVKINFIKPIPVE